MLQPRQLESVETRFPREIAVLREFFQGAALHANTVTSLSAVAARLREPGSFRRDLSSHLMVFAHDGISPADVLGIIGLAAGDAGSAAATNEQDAHDVLRYILSRSIRNERTAPLPTSTHPASQWLRPAAVACLVSALLLGMVYLRHRTAATVPPPQPAPAAPTATLEQPNTPADNRHQSVVPEPNLVPAPSPVLHQAAPQTVRDTPRPRTAPPHTAPQPSPAAAMATTQPVAPPQEGRTRPEPTTATLPRVQQAPSSAAVESRALSVDAAHSRVPTATPATVLSQRLDARIVPGDDPAVNPISGRAYPRLWRRYPASAATTDSAENNTLLANNVHPAPWKAGAYSSSPASAGTVRPVSLGTMAANIVYSPAPAYPQAAAAARVQGEVTIQAEVDRDGSVASARVVSGPPLLREAALEAVLRWRYHPRTVAGKPVSAAATAMVAFELP